MSVDALPSLRLGAVRELDEDHVLATFEAGPELRFEAGQWINLHVQAEGEERDARALSFASAPSRLPELEICVRRKSGSRAVAALEAGVGRAFEYDGPYGAFRRAGPFEQPTLFLASSTGLAPIRGMLEDGLASGPPEPAGVLLLTQADDRRLLFEDQHADWRARWPGLDIRPIDDIDESAPETWERLLEPARAALKELDPNAVQVWMAGHAAWIKPFRAELRERWELDRRQVKAEIFWP